MEDEGVESRTIQPSLSDVPHRMFDRPNNTIDEELELLRQKTKQRWNLVSYVLTPRIYQYSHLGNSLDL